MLAEVNKDGSSLLEIFLEKNQKFIKNGCDFKRISTDLRQLRVIDKSQLNKLLHSDILEANQHMYLILESDLSPPKLSKVVEALEGDTTHDGHQDLACRIRECLCSIGTPPLSVGGPSGTHPPSVGGPSGTHPPSVGGPSGTHPPSVGVPSWGQSSAGTKSKRKQKDKKTSRTHPPKSKRKRLPPHSPSPEEDGSNSGSNSSGSNSSDDRVTGPVEEDNSEVDDQSKMCGRKRTL